MEQKRNFEMNISQKIRKDTLIVMFEHITVPYVFTWEKFTITGRMCATQSWGSNNFPRAAQPSTASNLTESWSELEKKLKK